jgi:hypothetical protein
MSEIMVHVIENGSLVLVAACDRNLIGKTFRRGRLRLEVRESFYGGSVATVAEAVKAMAEADVVNLVGHRAIDAALKAGLADSRAVMRIDGVPHLQIVKL